MANDLKQIWVEKYRPKNLKELCISPETRAIIEGFGKNVPNLLLISTPGTGKTSTAKIMVLDVLKCDYLYINASDESGIDTVRDKISGFAQTKSFDGELKLVILDEVDYFSKNAMAALRNTMEEYASTTRFILTGNYKHKIIPALQSRCQELDVRPSLRDALVKCLHILKSEGINATPEQKKLLSGLVKSNFPDLRKCINEMQKHCRDGVLNLSARMDNSDLCEMILNNIQDKQSLDTRKHLIEHEDEFNSDWEHLLTDLLNYVYNSDISDSKKKAMVLTIADHLEKSSRVNDQEINVFACLLNLENM